MGDSTADPKAQVRAVFDRIAPDYDLGGPGCFAHFGRRLVKMVGVEPGQRVLDVATGRGAVLFPVAEEAGVSGRTVGIDLSEGMLRRAREEAARRGLAAEVRVMDAEALDFPDDSFDRVLCGFGVMFFPDLPQALAECRRVLRPSGRLGVSTWRLTQSGDLGIVLARLGMAEGRDPVLQFKEPETLARSLESVGFVEVRIVIDEATFRYGDLESYWQNARGTGLRRWLDQLDAAQTRRVRAALAEQLQQYRRHDGFHVPASALLAVASH